MAYEPLLAAGFYLLIICLSVLSSWQKLSKRGARKASSFAILALRVAFARIANVLAIVRWRVTNLAFILLFLCSLVTI